MPLTPGERVLRARLAAHASHAATANPSARAAKGAAGLLAKFEREIDPDNQLTPEDRRRRAQHRYKQHMTALALQSSKARRARREAA